MTPLLPHYAWMITKQDTSVDQISPNDETRIIELGLVLSCVLALNGYIAPIFLEERWPSGLRRTPGKRVERKLSGVRIPVAPP